MGKWINCGMLIEYSFIQQEKVNQLEVPHLSFMEILCMHRNVYVYETNDTYFNEGIHIEMKIELN